MTHADDIQDLRLAVFEKILEQYEQDPDSVEDELRGLIEAYLAQTADVYGS